MKTVGRHFINGRFVDSHGRETADIHNPATGELIGHDDEAVAIANDTEYGLHAYIHGEDRERARAIANRVLAGRVAINEFVDDPISPFGGFKMSGFGREFGIHGLQEYLETRTVFVD